MLKRIESSLPTLLLLLPSFSLSRCISAVGVITDLIFAGVVAAAAVDCGFARLGVIQ